jgi:hypothetical protein
MASAEHLNGKPQPERTGISRREFLRKMAPGYIAMAGGTGANLYENIKRNPPHLRQTGELLVALAGTAWNIRQLLKLRSQETGSKSQQPQTPPQK